ncbi:Flavin-dependent thymidylate synthase [Pandoraea anhela]|uniref:FAD-dependent thymidylate synthase n=2 Tax=Pandoraea anhela TaxID=2508295 RepID=A0A5E4YNE6_9BURK|nr:Flavin-dependent thymidylate synthase [Pandoraea anhela]
MSCVKLIAITRPVIESCQTAGELVAFCARVSNPGNQLNHETAPRLLKYLVKNRHWSPFEMAHMVVEITTTRDIARQILRHRSFSFQEFSQRYAAVQEPPVFREARLQDQTNRQNSLPENDPDRAAWWETAQRELAEQAQRVYRSALEKGLAKEVARAVLPEGLTPSTLLMSGSIRSFVHYVTVRADKSTQLEHRQIAEQVREIMLIELPELIDVLAS